MRTIRKLMRYSKINSTIFCAIIDIYNNHILVIIIRIIIIILLIIIIFLIFVISYLLYSLIN